MQKAYYIKDEINETFTDAEVRYIIDAIIFSKHINKIICLIALDCRILHLQALIIQ